MSLLTTTEIAGMKDIFKQMVSQWLVVSNGIHQTKDIMAKVDSTTADADEMTMMDILNNYETEYFYSLKKLFRIDLGSNCLFNDDWFWAEWDASDTCFYFVLGLTAEAREEFMHGGNKDEKDN